MFVSLTASSDDAARPASDIGYLLHKHPDKLQRFAVSTGSARVFFPVATASSCTVALELDIDPIALQRNKRLGGSDAFALAQYVNDRPYAASSMLAVALGKVFVTARKGRCEARPELVEHRWELAIHVPALPCRGGNQWAHRFFEPLGWQVAADPVPLDPGIAEWGESRYVDLRLTGRQRLADALTHLYVMLPVLDDAKHYWVGEDEVDKLIAAGDGWLAEHPERDAIVARYLSHRRTLTQSATDRLLVAGEDLAGEDVAAEDVPPDDAGVAGVAADGLAADGLAAGGPAADGTAADRMAEGLADGTAARPERLAETRQRAILAALDESGATSVVDLGCGEGRLLAALMDSRRYTRLLGADVSVRALDRAAGRLRLDTLPDRQRERIGLVQSALTYRDTRLAGFDAAVLQEVLEHIDPPRIDAVTANLFGAARPGTVIVTTPNVEFNVHYDNQDRLRHPDHRFEWTRAQFAAWAELAASRYGYRVELRGVGDLDPALGQPTQLAVFTRNELKGAA